MCCHVSILFSLRIKSFFFSLYIQPDLSELWIFTTKDHDKNFTSGSLESTELLEDKKAYLYLFLYLLGLIVCGSHLKLDSHQKVISQLALAFRIKSKVGLKHFQHAKLSFLSQEDSVDVT